jgi:hypothetical protein
VFFSHFEEIVEPQPPSRRAAVFSTVSENVVAQSVA